MSLNKLENKIAMHPELRGRAAKDVTIVAGDRAWKVINCCLMDYLFTVSSISVRSASKKSFKMASARSAMRAERSISSV
jgi:hypothetical protein